MSARAAVAAPPQPWPPEPARQALPLSAQPDLWAQLALRPPVAVQQAPSAQRAKAAAKPPRLLQVPDLTDLLAPAPPSGLAALRQVGLALPVLLVGLMGSDFQRPGQSGPWARQPGTVLRQRRVRSSTKNPFTQTFGQGGPCPTPTSRP